MAKIRLKSHMSAFSKTLIYLLFLHSLHGVHAKNVVSDSSSDFHLSSKKFHITLNTTNAHTERLIPINADVHILCLLNKPKWYKDYELLTENRLLILKSVQPKDAGIYSCQATQPQVGSVRFASLTLRIDGSVVLTQPQTKEEGDIADFSKVEDEDEMQLRLDSSEDDTIEEVAEAAMAATTVINSTALKIVQLHNPGPPQFQKSYKLSDSVHQPLGSIFRLSCPAFGNPMPVLNWFHNKSKLHLSPARYHVKKWSLIIENATAADAGTYTCKISNEFGSIEHNIELRISGHLETDLPRIVDNTPLNQLAFVNNNLDLECHVESRTPVKILWVKHRHNHTINGKFVIPSVPLNMTYSSNVIQLSANEDDPSKLHLARVQPTDAGFYSCIAVNDAGKTMATAYLQVLPLEKRLISASKTNVETLEKPAIVATEEESRFDKGKDKDSDITSEHKMKYAKLSAYINVTADSEADVDGESDVKDSADIANENETEESPPQFKKADKLIPTLHKPAGSTIQLLCPAIGSPMPNITWTRNNTEIMRHIGKVTYKKWSMQMDEVIAEDSGVYKCTVCNKLGCIEHSTRLTIMDRLRSRPIHSDKFPQNQTVLTNSSAYFECRVVSDLEPHIFWVKYNRKNESIANLERIVANSNPSTYQPSAKDFIKLSSDPDKPNVLRLENVTHSDEGWYTCVAANNLGESMASAYLRVVDKLPSREVAMLWRAHPVWMTVAAIVIVLLFLFGSIFIIYVLRKLKHEKLLKHRIETVHQWTKKVIIYKPPSSEGNSCDLQMPVIKIEKQRTTFQASNMDPTQGFNEYEFPLDSNWEIPRTQLSLGSTLGEGAFGRVVMAEACGLPRTANNISSIVAVKMVKEEHTDADMASLVREMEVMKMIGKHINIINLLGCCTQNGPLWVIVEFAPHGNLKDFLKKHRPLFVGSPSLQRNSNWLEDKPQLTEKKLISFAFQIARGMEYLASRRKLPAKVLLRQKHLIDAFNTTRPSLSAADVAKYQKTYARFTNKERGGARDFVAKRATLA